MNNKNLNVIPLIFRSLLILEGCGHEKTRVGSDTINENASNNNPQINNNPMINNNTQIN